jgi:hypothetical protein
MKKIGLLIRNFYRITVARPSSARPGKFLVVENEADDYLKSVLKDNAGDIEPDPEMYQMLANTIASKRKPIVENSLAGFFVPLFSLKNFELKMALVSLILVVSLGINPSAQYQINRKISPFSLADTLIDSSRLDNYNFPVTDAQQ